MHRHAGMRVLNCIPVHNTIHDMFIQLLIISIVTFYCYINLGTCSSQLFKLLSALISVNDGIDCCHDMVGFLYHHRIQHVSGRHIPHGSLY